MIWVATVLQHTEPRLGAVLEVAEIGEDLPTFEVAHIVFHIVPVGGTIGGGGKGDNLLGQARGVAFVAEVVLATDAVGDSGNIGARVFVQVVVVTNGHIRGGDEILSLINGIAHHL